MSSTYILYNPYAGGIKGKESAKAVPGGGILTDMTAVEDYGEFFAGLSADDRVIICGGDGTLNRFVNDTDGVCIPCDVLYYAAGSGNDFLNDLGYKVGGAPLSIKEYITDLPRIIVNGESRRFINGVGLGLDGYCCAEVARAKAKGKRKSYVSVAIMAFLKDFVPAKAEITVDGKTYANERVWLIPTMKGRFFGGGVMAAPGQDRRSRTVTVLWMHGAARLTALFRFPSFLNGKHVKYKKMISIIEGTSVTVRFERPTDLQIDGEPIEGVTEYTVECN